MNFDKLTGEVITKSDSRYEEARQQWNRAIEKYPLAIVYCSCEEDIVNAVKWARENYIAIRIRSGGHHYEGFSTGDDVLVIDVSRFNKIEVDEIKRVVYVDGGVRNRQLYDNLCSKGYPFPGGGCPTVGVVGYTLGGGWGYSARFLGLGCDSLLEAQIINYNGEKIVASDFENKDLFWALRGSGGGNFGVVTKMVFKIPPKVIGATLINIEYPNRKFQDIVCILETYQTMYDELDYRVNFKLSIYNSKIDGIGVKIIGIFYGTEKEALEVISPLVKIEVNSKIDLKYMTIDKVNKTIQDAHPDYESYKSSGRFVVRKYNKDELLYIVKTIETVPSGCTYTAITFYGLGGMVSEVNRDKTAFYYREAKFILGFQTVWENPMDAEVNKQWMIKKFEFIKTFTKGSFVNFPMAELDHYKGEYYGEHVQRLVEIKDKYDPKGIFEFPQRL